MLPLLLVTYAVVAPRAAYAAAPAHRPEPTVTPVAAVPPGAPAPLDRPVHHRRPAHARGQTDFTAYTLEWGEVRVGLKNSGVGVLPRTQLTTQPLLDVLGAPNASMKVNALRAGPLDLSATADWGMTQDTDLFATFIGAGATVSLQIARPWSVHGGASWMEAHVEGTPELEAFALILGETSGVRVSPQALEAAENVLVLDGHLRALTAHAATDVRLNGRDSIVLQARAVLWSEVDVPRFFERVAPDRAGWVPLTSAYTVSLAWQLSWRNVDVRIGGGISSVPGAWLLNSVDLAYRFGGPTRVTERRAQVAWRRAARQRARDARDGAVASN
ncbi:MAG: hypothetical protein Q8P41_22400 [Pseudomonadota bacterium]|nr:hypothetical protein [Pseudomonadota bacterium]